MGRKGQILPRGKKVFAKLGEGLFRFEESQVTDCKKTMTYFFSADLLASASPNQPSFSFSAGMLDI